MDAIKKKKLRTVALFVGVSTLSGLVVGILFVAMGEPSFWPPRLLAAIGVGISEEFVVPRAAVEVRDLGVQDLRGLQRGVHCHDVRSRNDTANGCNALQPGVA
ncbi:MAG: hypothetical protein OEO23_04730 [Gemmatimonadota bacterium]|nr:hypothetical protein [Gemmatimonadota bacterium]